MALRLGDRLVGVRIQGAALAARVRHLLAAHVTDEVAPVWFWAGDTACGTTLRGKLTLHQGRRELLSTASTDHLVRALLANLAAVPWNGSFLQARLLVADGHVVLAHPAILATRVERARPALARSGYRRSGLAGAIVSDGKVHLVRPADVLDVRPWREPTPPRPDEPVLDGAALPVRRLVLPPGASVATTGRSVLAAAAMASRPWEKPTAASVRTLVRLVAGTPTTAMSEDSAPCLARAVAGPDGSSASVGATD